MIRPVRNLYCVSLKTPKGEKYTSYIVADNPGQTSEVCAELIPEDVIEEIKLERRVVCA